VCVSLRHSSDIAGSEVARCEGGGSEGGESEGARGLSGKSTLPLGSDLPCLALPVAQ